MTGRQVFTAFFATFTTFATGLAAADDARVALAAPIVPTYPTDEGDESGGVLSPPTTGFQARPVDPEASTPPPIKRRAFGYGIEFPSGLGASDAVHQASTRGWSFALSFGVIPTLRVRMLRVGLILDATVWFSDVNVHTGVVIGPQWEPIPGTLVEVLAEGGLSWFKLIEPALFDTAVTDTTALLPYAGVRASVGWRFDPNHPGFVALFVSLREELQRQSNYPLIQSLFSSGVQQFDLGGTSLLVGVSIGISK